MGAEQLFDLEPRGVDAFVGRGPRYPWGGLYGGQIVGQALRAAANTVEATMSAHSLRAYFIRRGDHTEQVVYDVDRIRDGRSFATRRVVARQAVGAILNLEASFQLPEGGADVTTVPMPSGVTAPESLEESSWSSSFERRFVDHVDGTPARSGTGRMLAWMRVVEPLDDDPILHRSWHAFLSDDMPSEAVAKSHPPVGGQPWQSTFVASLDHSIWFHRPSRADQWHLHDFTSFGMIAGRGLAVGQIYDRLGVHVATVAQEVLMRDGPAAPPGGGDR